MPTSYLDFVADAQSSVKMKWKEPYVTEGLNRRYSHVTPRGAWRGFTLGYSASNQSVKVEADSESNDHLAIYTTDTEYSLFVRKTGPDFDLNLAAYANKTVVIAIYATYAVGSTSTMELRAYEYSPTNEYDAAPEKDELVVLGMVTVPAGAVPTPATSITPELRTYPWQLVVDDSFPWPSLLKNGSFDDGPVVSDFTHQGGAMDANLPYWNEDHTPTVGTAKANVQTADTATGEGAAYELVCGSAGNVVITSWYLQYLMWQEVEPGEELVLEFYYKSLLTPDAGEVWVQIAMIDTEASGSTISYLTLTADLDMTASASWVKASFKFRVPAGQTRIFGVYISDVDWSGPTSHALDYTSPGVDTAVLRIDEVRLNKRAPAGSTDPIEERRFEAYSARAMLWATLGSSGDSDLQILAEVEGYADEQADFVPLIRHQHPDKSATETELPTSWWPRLFVGDPSDSVTRGTKYLNKSRIRCIARDQVGMYYQPILEWVEQSNASTPRFQIMARYGQRNLVMAHNCTWNNTSGLWTRSASFDSFTMDFGGNLTHPETTELFMGIWSQRKNTVGGSWADTAWTDEPFFIPLSMNASGTNYRTLIGRIPGGLELGTKFKADYATSDTTAETPRILTRRDDTATFTLLWEMHIEGQDYTTRIYQTLGGGMMTVVGAWWDQSTALWNADSTGVADYAMRTIYTNERVYMQAKSTNGVATFADSAWLDPGGEWRVRPAGTQPSLLLASQGTGAVGSLLTLSGPTTASDVSRVVIDKSNPLAAAAITVNALYSKNIPKMFAQISTDGGGGVAIDGGFGIASVALNGTADIDITLTHAMTSTNEIAMVCSAAGASYFFRIGTLSSTVIRLTPRTTADAAVNLAGIIENFHVIAFYPA